MSFPERVLFAACIFSVAFASKLICSKTTADHECETVEHRMRSTWITQIDLIQRGFPSNVFISYLRDKLKRNQNRTRTKCGHATISNLCVEAFWDLFAPSKYGSTSDLASVELDLAAHLAIIVWFEKRHKNKAEFLLWSKLVVDPSDGAFTTLDDTMLTWHRLS